MSMEDTGRSRKAQELNRKVMATHGTWENAVDEKVPDMLAKRVSELQERGEEISEEIRKAIEEHHRKH